MPTFTKSLHAWQTPAFEETLRTELEALGVDQLPLQAGLRQGSHALADTVSASILGTTEDATAIHVKAGLFYRSLIAGCNCADDPTPDDELNEYCEIRVSIDRASGAVTLTLVS